VYFVEGDQERLDRIRAAQPTLGHPDERFMLDAPQPNYEAHRSFTAGPNVNSVLSGMADHEGRRWPLFFKPIRGVNRTAAAHYDQRSPVDVGIHEIAAWWLARELGSPWSDLVAPAVWLDPPGASDIDECGPVSLGMGGSAQLPEPGEGFDQLISDAAFFDALVGSQDRHDQNLRASTPPPNLGLIDHGYAFAGRGDHHNGYPTAGFFLRMRYGQRRFMVPGQPVVLDYGGVGALSPSLTEFEQEALERLRADPRLLGVAEILSPGRAVAVRVRVERMHQTGQILPAGDF
jgi:hypothetical protein